MYRLVCYNFSKNADLTYFDSLCNYLLCVETEGGVLVLICIAALRRILMAGWVITIVSAGIVDVDYLMLPAFW
jgi:hypothetical protein